MPRSSKGPIPKVPANVKARGRFLDNFLLYQLSVAAGNSGGLLTKALDIELSLSLAEWRVILIVGEIPNLSNDAVAARTTMDKARVSRAIARLVSMGVLNREVDDSDRRLIALSLTKRGSAIFQSSMDIGEHVEARFLAPLSKSERAILFELLIKLSTTSPTIGIISQT
jgi:DNA-binding MarR family transcriptional regulator